MSAFHRLRMMLLLAITLAMLTGCEFNFNFPESSVGEIATCTELDDNMRCVDGTETAAFDGYAPMNASANAIIAENDVIEVSWTTDEYEIERVEINVEEAGFYPVGAWAIPEPVLPNGLYTVTYYVNKIPMQHAVIEVTGVIPEITDVVPCLSEPIDGECTPRTDAFDGSQTLHFLIEVVGTADSDTLNAQFTLEDEIVAEVDIPLVKDSRLPVPFQVSPTPVLLSGDYQLALSLNDRLEMTVPVTIQGPTAQVIGVETCDEVDGDQGCVRTRTIFDGASPIYASASFVGMNVDDEISVRWLLGDQEVANFSYLIDQPGNGAVAFNISPRSPLPVGDYLAEIIFDSTTVAKAPFFVSRFPDQPLTPVRDMETCREISPDYECIKPTTIYPPSGPFYLWIDLVNLQVGDILTARWLEGDGTIIQETPFTIESDYTGTVYFDLIPDIPFPSGSYVVELYYNDQLIDPTAFSVAAR